MWSAAFYITKHDTRDKDNNILMLIMDRTHSWVSRVIMELIIGQTLTTFTSSLSSEVSENLMTDSEGGIDFGSCSLRKWLSWLKLSEHLTILCAACLCRRLTRTESSFKQCENQQNSSRYCMIQALRLVRGFNVQQCVLMWDSVFPACSSCRCGLVLHCCSSPRRPNCLDNSSFRLSCDLWERRCDSSRTET